MLKQHFVNVVATGEEAEGFLRKFARASRRDLCEEGGVLHEQWKKYADLENEKTIAFVGGVIGTIVLDKRLLFLD